MFDRFKGLRNFIILWLGQSLSQLGSSMTAFALSIWAFRQEGTVMSVALLCVCNYVPAALTSLFAGTWVDRHSKKAVMLAADSVSAAITVTVLCLLAAGKLRVSLLYAINACLGVCGAFQSPASNVAISLLVPKEQYMRTSGMQSFAWSLQSVLSPIFATAALAFGGLSAVLAIDLGSFAFAFISLIILKIPETISSTDAGEKFGARFRGGLTYLSKNKGIRQIVMYLGLINLVAGISYYSVLSPMILARTGGNEIVLGWVNSCIGLGMAAGAALLTWKAPRCRLTVQMCAAYMLSFLLADFWLGVGRSWPVWCAAALFGNLPLPYGDGALMTLLRGGVPTQMQGRIFSVRDCAVKLATTAGYLAGALLADRVCGPILALDNPISRALSAVLGTGEGRAMGLVFIITGLMGVISSATLMRSRALRELEERIK